MFTAQISRAKFLNFRDCFGITRVTAHSLGETPPELTRWEISTITPADLRGRKFWSWWRPYSVRSCDGRPTRGIAPPWSPRSARTLSEQLVGLWPRHGSTFCCARPDYHSGHRARSRKPYTHAPTAHSGVSRFNHEFQRTGNEARVGMMLDVISFGGNLQVRHPAIQAIQAIQANPAIRAKTHNPDHREKAPCF